MRTSLVVCLLLAACGDDGVHHLADAPAAPDGSVDAATSGAVTLTITLDDQPVVGVDVYFQDADSTLVAKVATDVAGVATAVMEPGGYVTAVDPFARVIPTFAAKPFGGVSNDLRTFAGVKPGDQLKLHETNLGTSLTVTLTAPNDANATTFEVYTSCGGYSGSLTGGGGSGGIPSGTVFLYGCGATADFLVQSFDGNGAPLASFYKPDVAVVDQGTVDLTAEAYTSPVPSAQFTWNNVPAAFTDVSFQSSLASPHGRLFDSYSGTALTGGSGTATVSRPGITNGTVITSTQPQPPGIGSHFVLDWAPASANQTIDLGGALLPDFTVAPTIAVATHSVTWSAAAGGVQPDLIVADVSAWRPEATPTAFWSWSIAMPHAGTTFTLPTLPADVGQYNLVAGDGADLNNFTIAKVPGGYDAVRAQILSLNGPEALAVTPTGRLVYEMLSSQIGRRRPPTSSFALPPAFSIAR